MLCQIWKCVGGVETHVQVSMSPLYYNSKATLASWKVGWFVNSYQLRSVSWVPPRAMTRLSTWFVHHNLVRWCVVFFPRSLLRRPTSQTSWLSLPSSRATACSQATSTTQRDKLCSQSASSSPHAAFPTRSCSPFSSALPSVDPSFLLSWWSSQQMKRSWMVGGRGNPLGFDEKGRRRARTCTCLKSPHLYIHAKEGQTSREEERGVRWPGSAF